MVMVVSSGCGVVSGSKLLNGDQLRTTSTLSNFTNTVEGVAYNHHMLGRGCPEFGETNYTQDFKWEKKTYSLDYEGITYVSWTKGDYPFSTSWEPQTYWDSQAVTEVSITANKPCEGKASLELTVELIGQDPENHKRNGETFVDLRYRPPLSESPHCIIAPVDFSGVTISARIWCPEGIQGYSWAPNGLQLFVKDREWRSFYGGWHDIYWEDINKWKEVTVTPSTAAPPGGWMDPGFDPTNVVMIGVKIGTNDNWGGTFSGEMWLDDVTWSKNGYTFQYDFENVENSLDRLKKINANYVALIDTQYMENKNSSDISPDPKNTHTEAEIIEAIDEIHKRGMSVMLKPHIDVQDGTWRGEIDPSDKDAWFESYNNFIIHYAQIAQENDVEFFCIGTEFESLHSETYRQYWNTIIDSIKDTYEGQLTYAANWDGYAYVSFWDKVDLASINAYFPLSEARDPLLEEIMDGWTKWVHEIEAWQLSINKPVIFTEIGYRSIDYAAQSPWDSDRIEPRNCSLQARCYEAAINVFGEKKWFKGMFWWNWLTVSDAGGCCNTDFTPQNKLAESTLAALYGINEEKAYEHLYEVMDKYHNSFDVYTDLSAAGNHFVCLGRMASEGDEDAVDIDPGSTNNPYSGATCIENCFYAKGANWGGWYFLNGVLEGEETQPESNWGEHPEAGCDLTEATKLTFWARGKKGGERVEFFALGAGRNPLTGEPTEPYPDSSPKVSLGYTTLSTIWTEYIIDLKNKDLSYVIGGFGWVSSASQNNNEDIIFYLDNIQYDKSRLEEPRFLPSYETIPSSLDFDRIMKNVAFVYDNALALLTFISRGSDEDWHRAKLIADAFVYAQNHDRYFDDGRLRNAYQAGDLILFPGWKPHGKENTVRMPGWWDPNSNQWYEDKFQVGTHTGNLGWAMIALLSYYEKKGGEKYLEAAIKMGEWIERECRDDRGAGGYTGGYEGWEETANNPEGQAKLLWKSTEHNIDVYVAFMKLYHITKEDVWLDRAIHAKGFVEAMWDAPERHFWTGTLEDGVTINKDILPVDVNTWGLMGLGKEDKYGAGIAWVENFCKVDPCPTCKEAGDYWKGFDFSFDHVDASNNKDGIWWEGTAQMCVAYQITGDSDKSDEFLGELRRVQTSANNNNKKGIVAACHDGVTTGFEYDWGPWVYYNRLHIGAVSWYIFAERTYNPYWQVKTNCSIPPDCDVNWDNYVNVLDMIRVGQHWGETGSPRWIPEDVKKDGVINVLDMIIIGQHWTG